MNVRNEMPSGRSTDSRKKFVCRRALRFPTTKFAYLK
jgi:hypothetical protein